MKTSAVPKRGSLRTSFALRISPRYVSFQRSARGIRAWIRTVKRRMDGGRKRFTTFVNRRPLQSFTILLLILFVLVAAGSFFRKPKPKETKRPEPKQVQTYRIGTVPLVTIQAKVEKSGVATVSALTPGVVSAINVSEGDGVDQGRTLVSLSSNYQGGSTATVQRQLAQAQLNNAKSTYDLQQNILARQKEIAGRQDMQADELRKLQAISNEETRIVIGQNEDILESIDDNLKELETTNNNGQNDAIIAQANQLKSQFLSGFYQLRAQNRVSEYNTRQENSPAVLSNLQREAAVQQFEVQQKALGLQIETARLQVQLAQVNEAAFYPASPFAGIVERVHVQVGQLVNPGTVLVTIHGDEQACTIVASVPSQIAKSILKLEPSMITIGDKTIQAQPQYVSQEATDGQLYTVLYTVPEEYNASLTDNSFVSVQIPVGYASTSQTLPFVPLDAVYQTEEGAYVFVVDGDKVAARTVRLGSVQGNYVAVNEGLQNTDEIILNRSVVAGERVQR